MRPSIWSCWAVSLLLGALMAQLVVTPAIAAPGSDIHFGVVLRNAAGMLAADAVIENVVVRRPDGRIRLAAVDYPGHPGPLQNPFVGNNVYNSNGARQTANMLGGGGQDYGGFSAFFDISIQNDGNRADRFRVKATGAASIVGTVSYYRGSTDITSAVAAGSFTTPSLAPGATYLIRAKIAITLDGGNVVRLLTIMSVASPTKIDAVKFAYIYVVSTGPGA
jgi:hypothetical protein